MTSYNTAIESNETESTPSPMDLDFIYMGRDGNGSEAAEKPDIFEYQDFRLYLADLFEFHHGQDRKYTKSFVCKKIGLANTRSYFNAVLNGRFVSKPKTEDFIRVFALRKREAEYFRIMVNYNQSSPSNEERTWYFDCMLAMKKGRPEKDFGVDEAYYKDWYIPVIRAMLGVHDIRGEFHFLAALIYPRITASEAEAAIQVLAALNLVQRDEYGFWKPLDNRQFA